MTQAPPQPSSGESSRSPETSSSWELLRDEVMAALEEDPVNERRLLNDLDQQRGMANLQPAQRVMAALMGHIPPPLEATQQLREALDMRQRWSAEAERSVPLRLALLEGLLRENRRRPNPLCVEVHLAGSISTTGVCDPGMGATSETALVGALQTEIKRARRAEQEAALLCLHLDGWAEHAGEVGRAAAERLMSGVILVVNNEIRDVDWSARSVGQDLVVFLSGTGRPGAALVAQRIVTKLAGVDGTLPAAAKLTASIGVATFPAAACFGPDLLSAARRSMFQAQAAGGNGVVLPGRAAEWQLTRVELGRVQVVVRVLTGPEASLPQESDAGEGILFDSKVAYDVGTMLEMDCIQIGGTGCVRLSGPVVLLKRRLDGTFEVGVACSLQTETAALLGTPQAATAV